MKNALVASIFTVLLPLLSSSQTPKADPPPGPIKLLPGYQHKTERGIDTAVGRIWKEGGTTITYDIGIYAGLEIRPDQQDRNAWYKEQTINNQTVRMVLTKERALKVEFVERHATFLALVPKEEDLADALLMILTYR
jgi:hypothetical protein